MKATARGEEVAQQHGVAARHQFKHALNGFAGSVPEGRLKALQNDPRVAFVEPNVEVDALSQAIPPGIRRIGAIQSPAAKIDGIDERVNVDIAIIDTGIDLSHPDLNVYTNVTFVTGTTSGNDDHGHGTHVAGIAAALDNNIGVVGVAPGARLWAIKVLDSGGRGDLADTISGVDYVTANASQIEVANMSLGGHGSSDSLRLAIQNSVARGVVYVVAAGNSASEIYGADGVFGTDDDFFPAAYPEVMTVSAMADTDGTSGGRGSSTGYGPDDTLATFSNFSKSVVPFNPVNSPGAAIDVAAPGVDIFSTYLGGAYATLSGTSMASPHVAGAAALYVSQHGRANDAAGVYAIRQALIDHAEPQSAWGSNLPNPNPADLNPEGLINVSNLGEGPPPSPDGTVPTCAITAPGNGATVSGTIPFAATASDDVGVSKVDFYVDDLWQTTKTASPYSFSWSTTAVGNGSHSLKVKAYDAAGNVGTSESITVTVQNAPPDTTPPTCSISSPASGATVSGTISVSVTASDNANVTRVDLLVDDFFGFTDTTPPFSFSWNTAAVGNGSHSLKATAYDAAGNSAPSATVTVTVQNPPSDATPPTCALTTPSNGATVSGTVNLAATASDNVGVSKVEFYADNVLRATDTTNPYSFDWDTTVTGNGSHSLQAKAYDAAGNIGSSTAITVNVQNSTPDTTPPTCSISSPSSGATVSGTTTVSVTASDSVGVTKVELVIDDFLVLTDTAAPFSFAWVTTITGNGNHSLRAKAYDAAGNIGSSTAITVNVQNSSPDTTPPTCSISSPSSGATVSGTTTVSVTASDSVGVTRVELVIDDLLVLTDSAAPFSFAWDTTTTGNGNHSLQAKAYDAAGNIGSSTAITVNVQNSSPDTTPPTCALTAPSNGATVSDTVALAANASDDVGVSKVEFYVDDVLQATDTSNPYSFSWDTTTTGNGNHSLQAKAYDDAGNIGSSESVTVNVQNSSPDTTPPTCALTTPSNGATVSGTVTLAATASDDVGVSKVEFYVDDVLQATDPTNPYSFSWDTTTTGNGNHSLQAKAYDAAGTSGSSESVTVNVQNSSPDTTPPTCALTTPSNGATVSGAVTLAATASDDVGVSTVEFYVDDVLQAADTTNPYSFSWDTTAAGNGSHSLQAKAYDAAGNSSSSTSITVNVQNAPPDTTPPTCAITAPSSGATISGTITLAATASDDVGVSKVEFYVDDVLQATDTTSPYSFSWNATAAGNGSHTLVAKAYDAVGHVGTSASVSVTVAPDSLPPTVVITSPTSGSNVPGNVKVSVSATDNVGVARVELYVDGSFYSSSTSATAVFTWNAGRAGKGPHTLLARAVDDAGNLGTSSPVTVYK